MAAGWIEQPT